MNQIRKDIEIFDFLISQYSNLDCNSINLKLIEENIDTFKNIKFSHEIPSLQLEIYSEFLISTFSYELLALISSMDEVKFMFTLPYLIAQQ